MWLQTLASELAITATDGAVWLSIVQGLLFGAVCLLLGIWVTRVVGLLEADAPDGETLGVGLASGLIVVAAWWAAVASGGRSSFTPVAIGFAVAIALAGVRRVWPVAAAEPDPGAWADIVDTIAKTSAVTAKQEPPSPSARRKHLLQAILGCAAFIVVAATLYGSTIAPSPRDGAQPVEFMDEAFYSILQNDLAKTGIETIYSPSGFAEIQGLPTQTWYHWGEEWLGAAVISIFGTPPLGARHFVVLPLLLLAAAAMTGTLVRRITGSRSRGAWLFGFLACLFLAPVPLARGLIYGITTYGLASVAVLLAIYGLAVLGRRQATWALAAFGGSAAAFILPAHVVIALLALTGIGGVWAIRIAHSLLATRRLPVVEPVWRRVWIATGAAVVATVVWGLLTGHGAVSGGLSPSVAPFNPFWRETVASTVLCSGAFLAIPVTWFIVRKGSSIEADLYIGTAGILIVGTLAWGALIGDFNSLHLFYGGIAVYGAPVAAIAAWSLWQHLHATRHRRLAIAVLLLCTTQLELGVAFGILRLQFFGPGAYRPVPTEILAAIGDLPLDAKLAYACGQGEESSFWDARLLSLDAHTGRRIVPICFQADTLGQLVGGQLSTDIPNPLFNFAPQFTLYPSSGARPSPASVASFLKANRIDYIYADARHPNSLVLDALPIATNGEVQILKVP